MPQLRHATTSALIAEAPDPLDLVVIAQTVGLDRVIFDDVGLGFDLDAAIDAAANRVEADLQPDGDALAAASARQATLEGPIAEAVVEVLDVDDPNPEAVNVHNMLEDA